MLTEPEVVEFAAQPYAAIRARTTMQTMDTVLVPLHPQVFGWLAERISATAFLLEWARRQNLAFDAEPGAGGDHWASRLEVYETDPDPDLNKWTTQLLFRLAD
jgi:hypothetical protein